MNCRRMLKKTLGSTALGRTMPGMHHSSSSFSVKVSSLPLTRTDKEICTAHFRQKDRLDSTIVCFLALSGQVSKPTFIYFGNSRDKKSRSWTDRSKRHRNHFACLYFTLGVAHSVPGSWKLTEANTRISNFTDRTREKTSTASATSVSGWCGYNSWYTTAREH